MMPPVSCQVLYEDNHLLALNKPAGVLVQGDRSGDATLLDAARGYLKQKYAKPGNVYLGLVHRLDRPVSGVVLLARTSKAAGRLTRQFRAGTVTKIYLAIVADAPNEPEAELVMYLGRQADSRGRTAARHQPFPGARESRLRYRVVGRSGSLILLEVQPLTGRRHQIRVQLAVIGCPILGDVKYGSQERRKDRSISLHARRLIIEHPVSGASLALTAPPPPGWPWPMGK
jgi:23S rRNA pseudouridine1911/1915/1917 synthase